MGSRSLAQMTHRLQRAVIHAAPYHARPITSLLGLSSSKKCKFSYNGNTNSSCRRQQQQRCSVYCWLNSDTQTSPNRSYTSKTSTSGNGTAVLSQTTSFLRNLDTGAEIFLLGTAHISEQSAQEVRDMITLIKPDVVMIELCPGRAERLRKGQSSDAEFFKDALSQLFRPGAHLGQQLVKLSLQGMYRMLHNLGMDVGGEFKAAMLAAEQQGAKLVYGDRDGNETLLRLSKAVRMEDIFKIMAGGGPQPPQAMVDFFENNMNNSTDGSTSNSTVKSRLEAQVEAMKTRAMARQMSSWMRELNPALATALIDERDEYMVQQLRGLKGRVVGVVGLAHLDGIERRWESLQKGAGSVIAAPKLIH
jgi:pheromone shutdown protein TraB